MWFKLQDSLINQENIIKIYTQSRYKDVRLLALAKDGKEIVLGTFNSSQSAESCIKKIQDHIERKVEVIDLQPLVNLSNLSYDA